MTTSILTAILVVVLAAGIYCLTCIWVESRKKKKGLAEGRSSTNDKTESDIELLYDEAKPYLEELEHGYKRKYESLRNAKELELRKFCIAQYSTYNMRLPDHIRCAEILYQYLITGKQPQNKEDKK